MKRQEPGKRIVSKGEYAKIQADRASSALMGGCLLFMALLCALVAIASLVNFLVYIASGFKGSAESVFYLVLIFPSVMVMGLLYFFGSVLVKEAYRRNPGVPLTRANTADLPVADSLVRASEPPLQAQEAVLLRAATEMPERQAELLRASRGEEKQP